MNQKIEELAMQANNQTHNEFDLNYSKLTDFLEKFSELIVKEYETLLPETCQWSDADKEGPMKGWHVQFVARKHFGIEK